MVNNMLKSDRIMDKEQEYEQLLYDYVHAYNDYEDMYNRADWVQWSPEAEKKAWKECYDLKNKIINIMLGEEPNEDNEDS